MGGGGGGGAKRDSLIFRGGKGYHVSMAYGGAGGLGFHKGEV